MMMLPATTASPPNFFTPRRRPAVSRPLRDEPPACLCAISGAPYSLSALGAAFLAGAFFAGFSAAASSVLAAAFFGAAFLAGALAGASAASAAAATLAAFGAGALVSALG